MPPPAAGLGTNALVSAEFVQLNLLRLKRAAQLREYGPCAVRIPDCDDQGERHSLLGEQCLCTTD